MDAITPEVTTVEPEGGVLVGDDGSECAAEAVRVAADEAVRRGLRLHVLRAWSIATAVRPADVPRGVMPSVHELETSVREAEQARVARLLAGTATATGQEAEVHVVHAAPTAALLHASRTADLLVVGTRGLGGFKLLVLGSVAEQCIRHAECNVLVVRTARAR